MELRLIPVVTFAAASLLAIKVVTILQFDGRTPYETAFSKGDTRELASLNSDDVEITGSSAAPKETPSAPAANPPAAQPQPGATIPGGLSPAERALLERLGERRQELDTRTRDMELRENLIKDAEKRLETRIEELKDIENRISGKGGEQAAKLKSLVVMYEAMKPKDAARIFDKLDQLVLVDVASVMNPRKLSEVLAQMNADSAQRLTVELAKRNAGMDRGLPSTDLKKIEARPGG
jgi:flagellar motility protein MotE (MotC chaperone)